MSHRQSDPTSIPQFRRHWGPASFGVKFLSEFTPRELDRLSLEQGERIVRRLPPALVGGMTPEERRDLARAFGRSMIRRLRQQRLLESGCEALGDGYPPSS